MSDTNPALLIDYGNTRLKWASWDGVRLLAGGARAHGGRKESFAEGLDGIGNVAQIWIASVVAAAQEAAVAKSLRERFAVEPQFVRSVAQACGVRNAYARPADLGVDRLLGMIAVHAQEPCATVIASCGTALTLDALAADGVHVGGLIGASPALAQSALRGATGRLGVVPAGRVVEFADATADAIASGTWLAAAALVERFCARARERLGAQTALVLTGGGAAELAALLTVPHRIDADLVLRGLAHYVAASRSQHRARIRA